MKADATNNEKEKDEKRLPVGQRVEREIIAWFWVALAFMLINGTIGQARVIPSGSMENTLQVNDRVIVSLLTPSVSPPR